MDDAVSPDRERIAVVIRDRLLALHGIQPHAGGKRPDYLGQLADDLAACVMSSAVYLERGDESTDRATSAFVGWSAAGVASLAAVWGWRRRR